jgi:CxxC-x17-CxxC domain-containing protein
VRPETRINCSQCGAATTVPFRPTQGRPVFCRGCFQQAQGSARPTAQASPDPVPTPGPS